MWDTRHSFTSETLCAKTTAKSARGGRYRCLRCLLRTGSNEACMSAIRPVFDLPQAFPIPAARSYLRRFLVPLLRSLAATDRQGFNVLVLQLADLHPSSKIILSVKMAQRVTLRKRQPYNTSSNRRRVVKTTGGKLVVHHIKKLAVSVFSTWIEGGFRAGSKRGDRDMRLYGERRTRRSEKDA